MLEEYGGRWRRGMGVAMVIFYYTHVFCRLPQVRPFLMLSDD